jgi:hypothetical protein
LETLPECLDGFEMVAARMTSPPAAYSWPDWSNQPLAGRRSQPEAHFGPQVIMSTGQLSLVDAYRVSWWTSFMKRGLPIRSSLQLSKEAAAFLVTFGRLNLF